MVVPLLTLVTAGCSGEERAASEQRAAREGLAVSESTATRAAAIPSTGLWTEEHLLERLVRAGVAPRALESPPAGPEWMGARPVVFHAGGGTLYAWIFADSVARRAVTDGLDAATAAPAGRVAPFEAPMIFVVQNNLAAVITGGSARNQERVALALQAGLTVTSDPPG